MESDWLTAFLTPTKCKFSNHLISTFICQHVKISLIDPVALEIPHMRIPRSDSLGHFWNCPTKNLQTIFYIYGLYICTPKIKLIHQCILEMLTQEFWNLIDWEPFWSHPNVNFQITSYLLSYVSMQKFHWLTQLLLRYLIWESQDLIH